jgi:hypothetical protein
MVGQMRCTVNYDFHNYFLMEKGDVACLILRDGPGNNNFFLNF